MPASRYVCFYHWAYFIFSRKEGAYICPTDSRIFLQDHVWEFKLCWLNREAGEVGWGEMLLSMKNEGVDFRGRRTITSVFMGFSCCLFNSVLLIGSSLGTGLVGGSGMWGPRGLGRPQVSWAPLECGVRPPSCLGLGPGSHMAR